VRELIQITRVDRPLQDIATLLGHRPADWLTSFASIAAHAGEAVAERVVPPGPRSARRSKTVTVDLADVPPEDDFARVDAAIEWHTSGFRWVFPSFRGRVTAVRETDEVCIVSLEGTYETPASAEASAEGDPARLAAEAAAEMLLRTLRAAVEEQVRSGA
jgi:hypothetical protein